jgi:hypothetical protein
MRLILPLLKELFVWQRNKLPIDRNRKKKLEIEIECERWRVKVQGISALAGLASGFILCSVALGGGIWCVLKGYQFGGGFIGGGGLIGLAAVFVYGSRLTPKEEK